MMQIRKLKSYKNIYMMKYDNSLQNMKAKLENIKFPERLKGTIIEKWADYWKNLCKDYYEVCSDTFKSARAEPKKTALIVSSLGLFTYCAKSNPDEAHFRDTLLSHANKLIFVGPAIRNPQAVEYLKMIESNFNQGTIRRFSFGVFSVVWVDNYDKYVSVYKAMCPYLKPQLLRFQERIIDVGFLNKWWIIDDKLKDFDINPNEWEENV